MFTQVINSSIIKRAIEKEIVGVFIHDFREFANNKHKKVDDTPYGGGAGMVISVQPIIDCLKSIPNYEKAFKILTSASGVLLNQERAVRMSQLDHLIIICGHYEGIDERIVNYIDMQISIGDYILTGGEIPAMAIIDTVIRLIPNVISEDSIVEESFSENLLEYNQYTKPPVYDNYKVPDVLLSGNHEEIRKYRRASSLEKTYLYRPDLLTKANLTKEDLQIMQVIKKKKNN
jgi:tRNA (guanine37-N1)-methyltransferase